MVITKNECVSCGFPCMHDACPNYRVTRYYCDRCKQSVDELREYEGEQLCDDCILDNYEIIEEE